MWYLSSVKAVYSLCSNGMIATFPCSCWLKYTSYPRETMRSYAGAKTYVYLWNVGSMQPIRRKATQEDFLDQWSEIQQVSEARLEAFLSLSKSLTYKCLVKAGNSSSEGCEQEFPSPPQKLILTFSTLIRWNRWIFKFKNGKPRLQYHHVVKTNHVYPLKKEWIKLSAMR